MWRSISIRLLISLAACLLSAVPAAAQENMLISFPAEKYAMTPGGVDLRTGRYVYSNTDLVMGPADGAGTLKLTRILPDYSAGHKNPFGNFSDNWDIYLIDRPLPPNNVDAYQYRLTLHMGGRVFTFQGDLNSTGTTFKSDGGVMSLTASSSPKSGSSVYYTAQVPDGTVLVFAQMGSNGCGGGVGGRRCAFVSEMTEADGTKYTFYYATTGYSPYNQSRLTKIISNRGYALLLEGSGSVVTKACVLNLTTATIPGNGLCPTGVPTTTYTYTQSNTKLASATDATGAVSQFTYTVNGAQTSMGLIKPGQSSPWLTNVITMVADEEEAQQEITYSQTFADGRTYTYAYDSQPATASNPFPALVGGTATDQAGRTITYKYDFPIVPGSRTDHCSEPPCSFESPDNFQTWTYQQTPGPIYVEDQLGRQTRANYCDPAILNNPPPGWVDLCAVYRMEDFTDPEGIKTILTYDGYGNIIKAIRNPRPGSSLTPITTEAAFATSNIKTQAKPLWKKDGRGNQTDYTYDSAHGGILTETKPAVNGIRPQTRYSYVQRYAWISNGSGGYVQAATPVWLPATQSVCRTSAATGNPSAPCTVTGDEVLTSYDYGPNSGPNNLWLRGRTVTADGDTRRTCYGYDSLGRKISETTPNANLASCP